MKKHKGLFTTIGAICIGVGIPTADMTLLFYYCNVMEKDVTMTHVVLGFIEVICGIICIIIAYKTGEKDLAIRKQIDRIVEAFKHNNDE